MHGEIEIWRPLLRLHFHHGITNIVQEMILRVAIMQISYWNSVNWYFEIWDCDIDIVRNWGCLRSLITETIMIWWWWWWQLKISVLHHASCHLMHGHKKLDWLVNSLLTTRFLEMLFWEIHSRSCLQLHQGGWVQIWNNKHSEVLTCLSGQAPLTHSRRSINIRPVQVGLVLSEPKYPQSCHISEMWRENRH